MAGLKLEIHDIDANMRKNKVNKENDVMNRITNIFDKLGISKEEFNQLLPRLPKSYVDFIGRRWDLKTGEELLNAVKYTPSE